MFASLVNQQMQFQKMSRAQAIEFAKIHAAGLWKLLVKGGQASRFSGAGDSIIPASAHGSNPFNVAAQG